MSGSFVRDLLLTVMALVAVLTLAWVLLRALRGRLLPGPGGATRTDDTPRFVRALPVGPRERVVVMDYRGERWLLGVTAGGIAVLDRHTGTSDAGIGNAPSSERPQLGTPPAADYSERPPCTPTPSPP